MSLTLASNAGLDIVPCVLDLGVEGWISEIPGLSQGTVTLVMIWGSHFVMFTELG